MSNGKRVASRAVFGRSVAFSNALAVSLLLPVTLVGIPEEAHAQVGPAIVGGVGGLVAGVHVTTGIFVLKSRATGWVMNSVEMLVEPGPELLPVVVGPVAGALMGARSTSKLKSAAVWGSVGLAAGTVAGVAVGQLLWKNPEGRWAGGVIGSASGLLLGAIIGAVRDGSPADSESGGTETAQEIRFAIPVPW